MPNCAYPGDSKAKREAREFLYTEHVKRNLPLPAGAVITLAGTYPHDLEYLRYTLKATSRNTWFVDTEPAGLKIVGRVWPEAHVYHGRLLDLLTEISSVAFINLDFMGPYVAKHDGTGPEPCVKALCGKLSPGAIISYTYLRCRESEKREYNKRILRLGTKCGGKTLDDKVRLGTIEALREDTGLSLTVLGAGGYRNGRSWMNMVIMQVPKNSKL